MTRTIIPVAVLALATLLAAAGLRRVPERARVVFDGICFVAISVYFFRAGVVPIFPPLNGSADTAALSLRVIAGGWWLFAARLAIAAGSLVMSAGPRSREARLFGDLSAAGIYVATVLIVLNSVFALPVTGLVATSGVVAIVLGLALQSTLADVFAGIAVGAEGPFRVGDRVQLNDKLEGVVAQVNWRSIRIRTDGDDIAIIPNSVVAKSEIVNRSFPSQKSAASIELSCPESCLPERVIQTLMDATQLCSGILEKPRPDAVLIRLGCNRNTYKIMFHVATSQDLARTKDALLRAARRQLHYTGLLDGARHEGVPADGADQDHLRLRRLLRDVILFESLGDDRIGALAKDFRSLRLEPDEVLFAEGASDQALYVVASGVIEIARVAEAPQTLGCIGAGDYVGEIGLLTGAAHAATARARTHSRVFRLDGQALAPLLGQDADLVAAFDKSARKGLEILHRGVSARTAPEIGGPGQLLGRIRSFFGFGASATPAQAALRSRSLRDQLAAHEP